MTTTPNNVTPSALAGDADPPLALTLFEHYRAVEPRLLTLPWSQWLTALRHRPLADKFQAEAFSPFEWAPGFTRGREGVVRVHALVLDLDHVSGLDMHRVVGPRLAASGVRCLLYSTYSHAPAPAPASEPRAPGFLGSYRLVVPLAAPVAHDAASWRSLWDRASWHLTGGLADHKASDDARLSFVPSHPLAPPAEPWFLSLGSRALILSELPELPPRVSVRGPAPPAATVDNLLAIADALAGGKGKRREWSSALEALALGRSYAATGSRDVMTFNLACELARRFPHETEAALVALFGPSIQAMVAENPTDAMTMAMVERKVADARRRVLAEELEAQAAREALAAPFTRVQGFQRMEQWPIDPRGLECVLSDGTRVFAGTPELLGGSEVSLARHVVCRSGAPAVTAHGATWLYAPELGAWRPLSDDDLSAAVRSLEGRPYKDDRGNKSTVKLSTRLIAGCVNQLQAETAALRPWFERAAPGVAFASSFVDATLSPRPHDPTNRATTHVAGEFEPDADPPLWRRTVREILSVSEATAEEHELNAALETEEKVRVLEEWVGVALLGAATRLGKALVLVGPPGAAKSFLVGLVVSLFPPELVVALQPHKFSDRFSTAYLAGRQLNAVGEGATETVRDIASIKAAITGSDDMFAEVKFRGSFQFRARAAQLWSYNELPLFLDGAGALADRLIVLRCEHVFRNTARDDKDRARRLAPEVPAIVSRCLVAGARALARGGYRPPASTAAEISSWAVASNPLREFIASRCEVVERGSGSTLDELHAAYKLWCEEQSRDLRVRTAQSLALQLRQMGHRAVISKTDGSRARRWDIRAARGPLVPIGMPGTPAQPVPWKAPEVATPPVSPWGAASAPAR